MDEDIFEELEDDDEDCLEWEDWKGMIEREWPRLAITLVLVLLAFAMGYYIGVRNTNIECQINLDKCLFFK